MVNFKTICSNQHALHICVSSETPVIWQQRFGISHDLDSSEVKLFPQTPLIYILFKISLQMRKRNILAILLNQFLRWNLFRTEEAGLFLRSS
jgi:hypothetical protein